MDRLGNLIIKVEKSQAGEAGGKNRRDKKEDKKKQYKVTFLDKIENSSEPLTRVHYVLSFKKYNAMNTFDPMEGDN